MTAFQVEIKCFYFVKEYNVELKYHMANIVLFSINEIAGILYVSDNY